MRFAGHIFAPTCTYCIHFMGILGTPAQWRRRATFLCHVCPRGGRNGATKAPGLRGCVLSRSLTYALARLAKPSDTQGISGVFIYLFFATNPCIKLKYKLYVSHMYMRTVLRCLWLYNFKCRPLF